MSRLFNILKAIIDRVGIDYIVDQGTTGNWTWRKWNSGRYEAERAHNLGQYSINTTIVTGIMCGGEIDFATPPHTLVSGRTQVSYISNSSNSGVWLEPTTSSKWRLCKATTGKLTLQNVTVAYRVVDGKWK